MDLLPPSSWRKVVVLAVHPDDESLAAGGLIQQAMARGADVRVIVVTDGDNNPWPQRFIERRWRIGAADRRRWARRRRQEAVAALACLGLPAEAVSFWGYPDQGLTGLLLAGGEEIVGRLSAMIAEWRPTLLVTPSKRDLHPDHNALAVLLDFALARPGSPPADSFALLEYVVHARAAETPPADFEATLSPEQIERKRQAVLCHATQVALSRRRFLAFVKPVESFLSPSSAVPRDPGDPVLSADFAGGFLCLSGKHLTASASLLLAAETPTGAWRKIVRQSRRNESVIADAASGEGQTHVHRVRMRDQDELFLPAAWFESVHSLFVKAAGGWGFFDRSGWCKIALDRAPLAEEKRREASDNEPRTCCVIPCYNLADICGPVVRAAADFAEHVIVVNDGSADGTERVLREIAQERGSRVRVLTFPENRGKGVALLEAFRLAAETVPFDVLVTLDGDGQHRPEDIPRLVRATVDGNRSLVIGERLAREEMPLRSRLGNTLTAGVMKLFHPAAPIDTQSGFRAFHRDFVREIVGTIEGGRYETELEILLLALRGRRSIGSVPIPTVYVDGNRLSHFRPIVDSWRIYRALFRSPTGGGAVKAELAANRTS
ncbi:MAG: hypothetical protein JWM88_2459 [Verrucomicrobia bacterium]|nr:hypothetical protein [Verrucomicrobiota bacterium]